MGKVLFTFTLLSRNTMFVENPARPILTNNNHESHSNITIKTGCVYNQNVREMIQQTNGLQLAMEVEFAAGFFRSFVCQKN